MSSDLARVRQAVVFCCDGNFLPYAAHAAAQIAGMAEARDYDICIASLDDLRLPDSLRRHGIRMIRVDPAQMPGGLALDARRTLATYLRIFLPQVLGADYDRILYLDADIWVNPCDLGALLALDLRGRPVACVRDNQQWRTPDRKIAEYRHFGLQQDAPYFNAGVMLIDTPAWSALDLTTRARDVARDHGAELSRNDQSLLNVVLFDNWAEISPLWNWQSTWSSRLYEDLAGAHIVHFIGPKKPWRDGAPEVALRYRRAYAAFLAAHFPAAGAPRDLTRSAFAAPRDLTRSLLKHFLARRAMARYLARFPSDLTVQ